MNDPDRFAPGAFHWCVDHVDVGDPTVSRLIRVTCRDKTIWPEQLLGYSDAGPGVGGIPLATGRSAHPRIEERFAYARRLLWRASYELTDLSIENIAALVGGYAVATVRPWARSWKPFERTYGRERRFHDGSLFNSWKRFGPHEIDLLGLEMPDEYRDWLDEPGRGLRPPVAA